MKVKKYILTDGLSSDHGINWKDYSGTLSAEAWHKEVESVNNSATNTILLGENFGRLTNISHFTSALNIVFYGFLLLR